MTIEILEKHLGEYMPDDAVRVRASTLARLLAVAKAAKAYHDMATSRYYSSRVAEFKRKQGELGEVLARLEAQ